MKSKHQKSIHQTTHSQFINKEILIPHLRYFGNDLVTYTSFLFSTLRSEPDYRKYLTVFVGMGVILIHVITGYPNNNFDPLVGDTFKPLYYSFVFLFSFSFVISL